MTTLDKRNSLEREVESAKVVSLNQETERSQLTAVDLFCGSGAVTAALKQSGFRVLAAVDNDQSACLTFQLNHPEVKLFNSDIACVDLGQLPPCGRLDLLVVCAPCQPFSSQNKCRNGDSRAGLILQALRFIQYLAPRLVFFENVPGISASNVIHKLRRGLSRCGYILSKARTFDAASFGAPQRRLRCVLIATKVKASIKIFASFIPKMAQSTVRAAIGHLRSLASGDADPEDDLHRARKHHAKTLERLRLIPQDGGSRDALPETMQLTCHKKVSKNTYPDVYGRMKWDDVAPTLTTGCTDVTKGRFAHPEQDRAITLREAALLQGFASTYKFAGNGSQVATLIGNAVPLHLVTGLAVVFKQMLLVTDDRVAMN